MLDTFLLQIDLVSYILWIHALYHINMNNFFKAIFSKSIIFKVKNTFGSYVFKLVFKIIFINSSIFALIIINVKIFFNF